ncbi:MAG: hypothetical protein ACRD1T_11495 [Acidimicrobiia bacterium]
MVDAKAGERDEQMSHDSLAMHIEQLRSQIAEKDGQILRLQTNLKTYTDMVASKDAALRKYLT